MGGGGYVPTMLQAGAQNGAYPHKSFTLMILRIPPPVGKPPHGLGLCFWMHLVNGTGNSP